MDQIAIGYILNKILLFLNKFESCVYLRCANGSPQMPECPCECDHNGRIGNSCEAPCQCKLGFEPPKCDRCLKNFYGYPNCRSF